MACAANPSPFPLSPWQLEQYSLYSFLPSAAFCAQSIPVPASIIQAPLKREMIRRFITRSAFSAVIHVSYQIGLGNNKASASQTSSAAVYGSERHYLSRRKNDKGLKAIIRKGEENDD